MPIGFQIESSLYYFPVLAINIFLSLPLLWGLFFFFFFSHSFGIVSLFPSHREIIFEKRKITIINFEFFNSSNCTVISTWMSQRLKENHIISFIWEAVYFYGLFCLSDLHLFPYFHGTYHLTLHLHSVIDWLIPNVPLNFISHHVYRIQ